MRMLLFAVTLVALTGASYWALTDGPFSPGGGGIEGIADEIASTADAVLGEDEVAYTGLQAVFPRLARETYPVTGETAQELLESMFENGPKSGELIFFGLTDTQLDVRYDPVEFNGGCIISDVRVFLDVSITLPDWTPPPGADPQLVADWRAFRRALAEHEERHLEIALTGAERAHLAVAELYRPSCDDAEDEARRRLERSGVEASAIHRQFDAETAHGKTDGAVWPPVR